MNEFITLLNAAGRNFIDVAVPMLVQASLLIVILLLIDIALRRKVRAVFRYWIWMLVLLKLILPPSLCSPVSFGRWFGRTLEAPTAALQELPASENPEPAYAKVSQSLRENETQPPSPIIQSFAPKATPPIRLTERQNATTPPMPQPEPPQVPAATNVDATPAAPTTPEVTLHWQGLVLLIWTAIVLALLLLLLQRATFVRGLVAQTREASPKLMAALDQCRADMKLARPVALGISPNAASPGVCGLWHPTILIPKSLAPKLPPRDLRAILLHELAHIKRGDLWGNLIQTLLQIIYFYNPLLWLANGMIRRVREQAVDEAVLVAMGQSADDYPETLVNIAKLAFKPRPALSLRLIGVVESKSALTARIKHILSRPFPKSAKLGLVGLVAVVATAAFFLPMARAQHPKLGWVESQVALLPDCGVWLSDIDGQDLPVLDLASEQIVTLKVESERHLIEMTTAQGQGDILYYYDRAKQLPKITFLRSAGFDGAATPDEILMRTIIPPEMPWQATLTTLSKTKYQIRITRADEHGCAIHFHPSTGRPSAPKAVLPNGTTVELVGVCEYPSAGKQWWQADGSLLEQAPCEHSGVLLPYGGASETAHEFVVRLCNLPEGASVTVKAEPGGRGWPEARPDGLRRLTVALPSDLKQCQLRCDVAAGPWETAASSDGTLSSPLAARSGPVVFTEGIEWHEGSVTVTVTDDFLEHPHRIIAITKSGAIVESSQEIRFPFAEVRESTAYFKDIRRDEIAEFQLQIRPWTRARFHNVSLRPGQKTRVTVSIEPPESDTNETGESVPLPLMARAEKVMPVTEQEARRLNHAYVGTEHILLALARQETAVSAQILTNLGVDIETLHAEINKLLQPGPEPVTQRTLPRTPRAKRVMQYAREEAEALNHDYLGTEHILLALPQESNSIASQVLANLNLTPLQIRTEVLSFIQPGAPDSGGDGNPIDRHTEREIALPEWIREPVILDLASGQLVALPQGSSFSEVGAGGETPGQGDLVYVYHHEGILALMRGAVSEQANGEMHPGHSTVLPCFVSPHLPSTLTVTTIEGHHYEVTVLAADDEGCTLKYVLLPEEKDAGKSVVADLPNGVTVEFLAYSQLTPEGLKWWTPQGEPTDIPNVYEADVEGLGTVLAFAIDPPDIDLTAVSYQTRDREKHRETWRLGETNVRLVALEDEGHYANLKLCAVRWDFPISFTVPLRAEDVRRIVPVNQYGISRIYPHVTSSGSNTTMLTVRHVNNQNAELVAAVDSNNVRHRVLQREDYSGTEKRSEYTLGLPLERLAGVVFETRRDNSASVKFANVALTPDRTTQLRIEPGELTQSWERAPSHERLARLSKAIRAYARPPEMAYPNTLEPLAGYLQNREDFAWAIENVAYLGKGHNLNEPPGSPLAYDKELLARQGSTYVIYNNDLVILEGPDRLRELGLVSPVSEPDTRPDAGTSVRPEPDDAMAPGPVMKPTVSKRDVTGIVVDPNGVPVRSVQVALGTANKGVTIRTPKLLPIHFLIWTSEIVETDGEGRFSLFNVPEDFVIVASHESGFAEIDGIDFASSTPIRLERWGQIEGTLYAGGKPARDEALTLGLGTRRNYAAHVRYEHRTETKADGHFLFRQVRPGWLTIGRESSIRTRADGSISHKPIYVTDQRSIYVSPGQTLEITLGNDGRPLIGTLPSPISSRPADARWGVSTLETVTGPVPTPVGFDRMNRFDQERWFLEWYKTPEGHAHDERTYRNPNRRRYVFQPNGNAFRIDNIIPGRYRLIAPLQRPYHPSRPLLKTLVHYFATIDVPPMAEPYSDEPLDLGTLQWTMDSRPQTPQNGPMRRSRPEHK